MQSLLVGKEAVPDPPVLGEPTEQRLVRFCRQYQIPLATSVAYFASHCHDEGLTPEDLYHVPGCQFRPESEPEFQSQLSQIGV